MYIDQTNWKDGKLQIDFVRVNLSEEYLMGFVTFYAAHS